ncbi:magnesium transporter CorA family protein [Sphingomonas sp.]|uniref:magnesium transporter CorA family protein n=1 Tax=Sphingomonas sp. TaxID=28214 RepID=UPI0025F4BA28|nr:magnesium transporter CorA family protein [Sphingomonas sp.]
MLRLFGPHCDGSPIEASALVRIPDDVAWIDLLEPTREEEKLVETFIGSNVPTRDDLAEIEPSSRLYERGGMLYLTLSTLTGIDEGQPSSSPIGFILTETQLVTVRYADPRPFRMLAEHWKREPELATDGGQMFVRLLDAIVDRLADELERSSAEIEKISQQIFKKDMEDRRIPAARLTALLTRIGRAQSLLAKIRETAVSTSRLIHFLSGTSRVERLADERGHVGSLTADVAALIDHSSFVSEQLTFLLDASLGLISIEQNAAMKLFSWAALVFLPPTLVAGIYGMNFDHMPELHWLYGYPMALIIMLMSGVLPWLYMRRRGWI